VNWLLHLRIVYWRCQKAMSSVPRDSISGASLSSVATGSSSSNMRSNKNIRPAPSEIEFKEMKFLITDRPNDSNMSNYVEVRLSSECEDDCK